MNLSHLTLIRESRRKSKTRDSHRACYRENIDRAALDPFIYHSKFQSTETYKIYVSVLWNLFSGNCGR